MAASNFGRKFECEIAAKTAILWRLMTRTTSEAIFYSQEMACLGISGGKQCVLRKVSRLFFPGKLLQKWMGVSATNRKADKGGAMAFHQWP